MVTTLTIIEILNRINFKLLAIEFEHLIHFGKQLSKFEFQTLLTKLCKCNKDTCLQFIIDCYCNSLYKGPCINFSSFLTQGIIFYQFFIKKKKN